MDNVSDALRWGILGTGFIASELTQDLLATGMTIIFGAFAPSSSETPSHSAAPPIPGVVFIETVWYPFFLFSSAHHLTKSVPPPPSMIGMWPTHRRRRIG